MMQVFDGRGRVIAPTPKQVELARRYFVASEPTRHFDAGTRLGRAAINALAGIGRAAGIDPRPFIETYPTVYEVARRVRTWGAL